MNKLQLLTQKNQMTLTKAAEISHKRVYSKTRFKAQKQGKLIHEDRSQICVCSWKVQ